MEALSIEQASLKAPALATTYPSPRTGKKYAMFNSISTIDNMAKSGWFPVRTSQSNTHMAERKPFVKHMVIYRQKAKLNRQPGEVTPEVIEYNSHDGTTSLQFIGGLSFGNDLSIAVGDELLKAVRFRHHISRADGILDAVSTYGERLNEVIEKIEDYRKIPATRQLAVQMANICHGRILNPKTRVNAEQLLDGLQPNSDLWGLFLTIWNNIYNGGIPVNQKNGRTRKTKRLTSPVSYVNLSRKMWSILEVFRTNLTTV